MVAIKKIKMLKRLYTPVITLSFSKRKLRATNAVSLQSNVNLMVKVALVGM